MKNWMRALAMTVACVMMTVPAMAEEATAVPHMTADEYPVVDGSTATLPLSYKLMSEVCGISEEEAQQVITHNKTTESFRQLAAGTSDLLLVYEPGQAAYDAAKDAGVELEMQAIGRDALVFLLNTDNPLESLTNEQVLDIYTGKVANWKDVDGEDLEIVAYQRAEDSGSQVMMKKQVMKEEEMMEAPIERRVSEMGELIDEIASYKNERNAIGYSVYYYVHNMYIQDGIKLLQINGVAPTNETISDGSYPYCQDFYAVIRADEPKDSAARKLYNFLTTSEGRALVEEAGYAAIPAGESGEDEAKE